MGALDVCPFVPVGGVTMDDCINCSNEFGSRLSKELNVPLYLYEYSCTGGDHRRTLPQIRAGEYEGLKDKVMYMYNVCMLKLVRVDTAGRIDIVHTSS